MTIPIIPGKFNFLANLGRAGGAAARSAEEQRRFDDAESRRESEFFLRMQENRLRVEEAGNVAGTKRKLREQPAINLQIPILGFGLGGGEVNIPAAPGVSDAERTLAGFPTRAQRAKDRLEGKKADAQAEILRTGSPEAVAEVLETTDELTLRLANEKDRDLQQNALATRSVRAAAIVTGINIRQAVAEGGKAVTTLVDAAWKIAQEDAKSAGYVAEEQLTKTYIQAEIHAQALREEEVAIRAQRNRAVNQFGAQKAALDEAESYQKQAQRWTDLLKGLDVPDLSMRAMHGVVADRIAEVQEALGPNATADDRQRAKDDLLNTDTTIRFTRGFYEAVETYDRLKADYEGKAATALRQFQEAMTRSGSAVASPGATDPDKRFTPQQIEQNALILVRNHPRDWAAILSSYVGDNLMDQTTSNEIRSQIEVMQRRGVTISPLGGTP